MEAAQKETNLKPKKSSPFNPHVNSIKKVIIVTAVFVVVVLLLLGMFTLKITINVLQGNVSPEPTGQPNASNTLSPVSGRSMFQRSLKSACLDSLMINPNKNVLSRVDLSKLPFKIDLHQFAIIDSMNCRGDYPDYNSYIYITGRGGNLGERFWLSIFDEYSVNQGTEWDEVGFSANKIINSKDRYTYRVGISYPSFKEKIYVGDIGFVVEGKKELTLDNGEKINIIMSTIAIPTDTPKLIPDLIKYSVLRPSEGYEITTPISEIEDDLYEKYFQNINDLVYPENFAVDFIINGLNAISTFSN